MVDYSWNHGSLIINLKDFIQHWDDKVEVFDVYLKPGAEPEKVRQKILRAAGAEYGLVVQTRSELQERIDSMIERLRMLKDADEVARIRAACHLAVNLFRSLVKTILAASSHDGHSTRVNPASARSQLRW